MMNKAQAIKYILQAAQGIEPKQAKISVYEFDKQNKLQFVSEGANTCTETDLEIHICRTKEQIQISNEL